MDSAVFRCVCAWLGCVCAHFTEVYMCGMVREACTCAAVEHMSAVGVDAHSGHWCLCELCVMLQDVGLSLPGACCSAVPCVRGLLVPCMQWSHLLPSFFVNEAKPPLQEVCGCYFSCWVSRPALLPLVLAASPVALVFFKVQL
jgi:hypothetical protein